MSTAFRARQVAENVYWVGAIDWELEEFHGYATPRGSTYNAFLILDDKITLIDTVKEKYADELLARISSVIHPERIDYIVSNHSEMDHSGSLPKILEVCKPERVYASPKGVKALKWHFDPPVSAQEVKDGDSLDLGKMKLHFMLTMMVHWPDSMFSYLEGENILFSNDAFGMHVANSHLWTDELEPGLIEYETKTYYANILWPTSKSVQNVLRKLDKSDWKVDMIAPDHGPLWRKDLGTPMSWYEKWANGDKDPRKAVILFDTMWGSTAMMARAIAGGLIDAGMNVSVLPLAKTERAEVAYECLDTSLLLVGSPTLNGGVFPTVADALTYVGGLNPGKPSIKGAVFGSYGWGPGLYKKLAGQLEEMNIEVIADPQTQQYVPSPDDLASCHKYGKALAAQMAL